VLNEVAAVDEVRRAPHTVTAYVGRIAIWASTAFIVLTLDILTKEATHDVVLFHYRHITPIEFAAVAIFLLALAVYRSNVLALAAGLLFGALCGNGGELLLHGYATDWIRVGRWLTNVADIAVVAGLLCIYADILATWAGRWRRGRSRSPWTINLGTLTAIACSVPAGIMTDSVEIGLLVFAAILLEAYLLVLIKRRSQGNGVRQPVVARQDPPTPISLTKRH